MSALKLFFMECTQIRYFESLFLIKNLDDLTHLTVLFCLDTPDALSDRRHEYSQLVLQVCLAPSRLFVGVNIEPNKYPITTENHHNIIVANIFIILIIPSVRKLVCLYFCERQQARTT